MAKDSGGFNMGSMLGVGLVGVAAYFVYTNFFSTPGTPAAGTTEQVSIDDLVAAVEAKLGTKAPVTQTNTPPAQTPITTDSGATQKSKLLAAAGVPSTQLYDASQWNFYWQQLYGQNPGTLGDDGSDMLVDAYLNLIHGKGLGQVRLSVPMIVSVPGRRPVIAWASQQIHQADDGTSNFRPAGSPMLDRPRGGIYRRAT